LIKGFCFYWVFIVMKYVITESQYKLITEKEEDVLYIPSVDTFGGWGNLQKFLKKRGNPDYKLGGFLQLVDGEKVESLGNCISIEEGLYLMGSESMKTLGKLKYVGGVCDLFMSKIESIGDLEYVGGFLDIRYTNVSSLGKLTHVRDLYAAGTPLAKKYTKDAIRNMINIEGELVMV